MGKPFGNHREGDGAKDSGCRRCWPGGHFQLVLDSSGRVRDVFPEKRPRERKEILGEILGLGEYDALKEKALEDGREISREIAVLDGKIEGLRRIEEQESEVLAKREETEKLCGRVSLEVSVLKEALNALHQELADARHRHSQKEDKSVLRKKLAAEMEQVVTKGMEIRKKLDKNLAELGQKVEILAAWEKREDLRKKISGLASSSEQFAFYKNELANVERGIGSIEEGDPGKEERA